MDGKFDINAFWDTWQDSVRWKIGFPRLAGGLKPDNGFHD